MRPENLKISGFFCILAVAMDTKKTITEILKKLNEIAKSDGFRPASYISTTEKQAEFLRNYNNPKNNK